MKFLVLPFFAAALTGCTIYPDEPPVAYPSSAAVYGGYYSGYPHYGYYDRYPYYIDRHDRNWRSHRHHDHRRSGEASRRAGRNSGDGPDKTRRQLSPKRSSIGPITSPGVRTRRD